jgi:hypothetical protein
LGRLLLFSLFPTNCVFQVAKLLLIERLEHSKVKRLMPGKLDLLILAASPHLALR